MLPPSFPPTRPAPPRPRRTPTGPRRCSHDLSQAPSERNSRTRWLKIAAAFWLLLISAVALINNVGLSPARRTDPEQRTGCAGQGAGLRVADLEHQANADKRRPVPISQAEFANARQALDERMTRLEEADEARALCPSTLQTLLARVNAIETRLEKTRQVASAARPRTPVATKPKVPEPPFRVLGVELRGRRALSVDHLHRRGLARGRPAAARGRRRGRLATAVHRGAGGRVQVNGQTQRALRCRRRSP